PLGMYFVFTPSVPPGLNVCAFHSWTTCDDTKVLYAFMPSPTNYVFCNSLRSLGCNTHSSLTQSVVNYLAHELMEAITDPFGDAAGGNPARSDQGAFGIRGGAVGARPARRKGDGPRREGEDLRRHPVDRPRLRGQRPGREEDGADRRREVDPACRRRLCRRIAVRGGDRQDAAVRRHRGQARRPARR